MESIITPTATRRKKVKRPPTIALEIGRMQAAKMLARLGWHGVKIKFVWEDSKDTAYTDGHRMIAFPRQWHGVDIYRYRLTRAQKRLVRGFTAHEIIHFLQPLRKIREVEDATGLSHHMSNLIEDIQGEKMILRIFPEYKKDLSFLRRLVWRDHGKKWLNAQRLRAKYITKGKIAHDDIFRSESSILPMIARFGTPSRPNAPAAAKVALSPRGRTLCADKYSIGLNSIPPSQKDLPSFLQAFAMAYPEYCQPSILSMFGSLFPDLSGSQGGDEVNDHTDEDEVPDNEPTEPRPLPDDPPDDVADLVAESMTIQVLKGKKARRLQPGIKAITLSSRLRAQFKMDASTMRITAPDRFLRRELATGENEPYIMDLPKGKAIGRKVVIAVDYSGSMSGKINDVLTCAQALALAVKKDGGSVAGLQFGSEAFVSQDDDDLPIFASYTSLGGTTFEWLPYVWLRHKDSTIIVITDGAGTSPNPIKDTDRDRTHLILLGGGYGDPHLGTSHQCPTVNDLPKVLVTIANTIR